MKSKRRIISAFIVTFAMALCLTGAACSSQTSNESSDTSSQQQATSQSSSSSTADKTVTTGIDLEEAIANAQPDDPYVADEVCLSCHGGTYEALAELTDEYGDSNPHAGTHGSGGMSCDTCHVNGQSVPTDEDNMCLECHAWPREDQSYLEYMDL